MAGDSLGKGRKGGREGVLSGEVGGNNKFLYGLCASDNGERRHSISGGVVRLALPHPPGKYKKMLHINNHNRGSMLIIRNRPFVNYYSFSIQARKWKSIYSVTPYGNTTYRKRYPSTCVRIHSWKRKNIHNLIRQQYYSKRFPRNTNFVFESVVVRMTRSGPHCGL